MICQPYIGVPAMKDKLAHLPSVSFLPPADFVNYIIFILSGFITFIFCFITEIAVWAYLVSKKENQEPAFV